MACPCKSPPTPDGAVELGYSLFEPHQSKGYGTAIVGALTAWAFGHPEVQRVIGDTLPELTPSRRVLEKNGLLLVGEGSEPGAIRYVQTRTP